MNHTCSGNIKVFACNANKELAQSVANELGITLGQSVVDRFSDGEISVRINELVRGKDVFVIQPTCPPVNENLMELLIMSDALYRASAGRITAVMPYYGYARQDRKARARDPISAKLVADLLTTAGIDRVLTMDMHCDQLQGFFSIPVDHLRGMKTFVKYYRNKFDDMSNVVVVSPDLGSVTRARHFAASLDVPLAIVDKRRPKANVSEIMNVIGTVEGKKVIIIDDMIDTAGSLVNATNALLKLGATEVHACATHPILSGEAIERITASALVELVVTNTVTLTEEKQIDKIRSLSVATQFTDAIKRIHEGTSISELFD